MIEKLNHHYSMTSPASVYDEEALTALELAGRTTAKVNEVVESQNELAQTTAEHMEEQDNYIITSIAEQHKLIEIMNDETMPAKVTTEVQKKIVDGSFNEAIDKYAGNLEERLDNFFANTPAGGTTSDAELIDMRVDALSSTHASAGKAVRNFTGMLFDRLNAVSKFESEPVTEFTALEGVHNTSGGFTVSGGWSRCYKVAAGEKYLVSAYYGFAYPDVLFTNETINTEVPTIIGHAHTNAGAMKRNKLDDIIIVPEGADTMYVNWCDSNGDPNLIQARKISGYRPDFTDYEGFIDESLKPLRGLMPMYSNIDTSERYVGYIFKAQRNGQVWHTYVDDAAASSYYTGFFYVKAGQRVRISSSANFGNVHYYMFNAMTTEAAHLNEVSKEIHSYVEAPTGGTIEYRTDEIIVPVGVNCIGVGRVGSQPVVEVVENYEGVKPWGHLTCLCVGDSLTEENTTATLKYHDYIRTKTGLQIVNVAQSGRGIMRGYDTNSHYLYQLINDKSTPDVILIMASGNDNQYIKNSLGSLGDDISDNTYCGHFNHLLMLARSKYPKARVCVISSPPWKGSMPYNEGCGMDVMSNTLKTLCERQSIPFLDLYRCSNLNPDEAAFRSNYYSRDNGGGVHPDEKGHKIIASPICAFLENVIGLA